MPESRARRSWIGRIGRAEATVQDADTSIAVGSGDVPVLGTPRLIALMEKATCVAIEQFIDDDFTSVGIGVDIAHRRPTPVGATVVATATVTSVDDARIRFEVSADHVLASGERVEAIGRGTITRAVVERSAFTSDVD